MPEHYYLVASLHMHKYLHQKGSYFEDIALESVYFHPLQHVGTRSGPKYNYHVVATN